MAKDVGAIVKTLIERNPGVDRKELLRAFMEQVKDDPALREAVYLDAFNSMLPKARKLSKARKKRTV